MIDADLHTSAPPLANEKAPDALTGHERAALVSRLFREHNDALIGFLLPRVNSEQEARDVAQEAYVRILELDQPGAVSFLRAYLFRTAANLATDRARQRATRSDLRQRWIEPFEGLTPSPSPESATNACQELALLRRFMQELPPRAQQAFYLYRFRDLTAEEIAGRLGVTKRMVWKYIFRAFEYCKERMQASQAAGTRPSDTAP